MIVEFNFTRLSFLFVQGTGVVLFLKRLKAAKQRHIYLGCVRYPPLVSVSWNGIHSLVRGILDEEELRQVGHCLQVEQMDDFFDS